MKHTGTAHDSGKQMPDLAATANTGALPDVSGRAEASAPDTPVRKVPENAESRILTSERDKAMLLVAMAANFGTELPEALFSLWLDLLHPYPAPLVEAAVRDVVLHYEYKTLPPFAVLQKALDTLCGEGGTGLALQAGAEWVRLMDALSRRGSYNPPETLHPTTAYVLRLMGGWQAACQWPENTLDFKRRDFTALWADSHGNVDALATGALGLLAAKAAAHRAALSPDAVPCTAPLPDIPALLPHRTQGAVAAASLLRPLSAGARP